ncbi:unnamed protein product [Gordionus sp. m RMFG-2023]|uniref:adenine phosphoribosyltransferase-like n=1 Tax=Gordionus sp. m RMFG-2023 TaxID=3053472 RepID=UPI0030DFD51D
MNKSESDKLDEIRKLIKPYSDFPKKGVLFRDIFPVFQNPNALHDMIEIIENKISKNSENIDIIVGLDARGFLIAPLLAYHLKLPFVPVRKKGKLPGEIISFSYNLEYGSNVFEIQKGSISKGKNVAVIDDLLATGGSMDASCNLVESVGGNVVLCLVIMELMDLKGRDKLGKRNFYSMLQF